MAALLWCWCSWSRWWWWWQKILQAFPPSSGGELFRKSVEEREKIPDENKWPFLNSFFSSLCVLFRSPPFDLSSSNRAESLEKKSKSSKISPIKHVVTVLFRAICTLLSIARHFYEILALREDGERLVWTVLPSILNVSIFHKNRPSFPPSISHLYKYFLS